MDKHHSPLPRLRHILLAIQRIKTFTKGLDYTGYRRDVIVRDAVERNLERISEASRHIPEDLRSKRPEIAWRDIAGLGNVLRHGYDGINDRRIWSIVANDLGPLKTAVNALLRRLRTR